MNIQIPYKDDAQKIMVEEAAAKFRKTYDAHIAGSDGALDLFNFLQQSDFFTAPASTQFHGAHPGGLVVHSVNVYERLLALVLMEKGRSDNEKIQSITATNVARAALLHDLCKVDVYQPSTRNVKNEATGAWEKVPFYKYEDKLPFGHGEKSQYIASGFLTLTRSESMAIRWHMGAFDAYVKGDSHGGGLLSTAFEMFPLALLLHQADQLATSLDESCK